MPHRNTLDSCHIQGHTDYLTSEIGFELLCQKLAYFRVQSKNIISQKRF